MTTADLPRLAVQLYTLRDSLRDLEQLIPRLAADGYGGVELSGAEFDVLGPDRLASLLREHGMAVCSAHVAMGRDGLIDEGALDRIQAVGADTAVVAFMPPDKFKDIDGVQRVADKLAAAAEQIAPRGLTLGYHNHFWELAQIDGRPALVELFDRTSEAVVAEIDTYWARVGGVDPAELVAGLGDRARFLHVKDGPADDPEADMVAVGAGVIDVPAVLSANPAVRWHIVELDRCATDMYQAVADSQRYLAGLGLSAVRA